MGKPREREKETERHTETKKMDTEGERPRDRQRERHRQTQMKTRWHRDPRTQRRGVGWVRWEGLRGWKQWEETSLGSSELQGWDRRTPQSRACQRRSCTAAGRCPL